MSNNHRTNLKEYYKFVRTCSHCKKQYGSDFKKEEYLNICSKCYQGRGNYAQTGWRNKWQRLK